FVAHAGIVEEQVDAAENLDHFAEQRVHIFGPGYVAGKRQRLGLRLTSIGDGCLQHGLSPATEHCVPACLEQGDGRALAYAGSGSCDDCGLAGQGVLPGRPASQMEGLVATVQKGRSLATAQAEPAWEEEADSTG